MLKNLAPKIVLVFIATVFMYGNVAKPQVVTDGLVSYWSLDKNTIKGDTVEDIWGENDGTIKGNPKEIGGKIGEALKFDGDDSVDIPGTKSLNFSGKEELTVTAWVNVGAKEPVIGVVAGCCGTIVAQRDANGWALRYDGRNGGQEMEFIVCPGWQGDGGFGAPVFKEGEWHYLTGVVDSKKLLLYVD
ncbi:MAG: LamG-like jellyroll fold domain-containing protein, partial [Candidatus Poribacteria bacterium]